MQHTIILTDAQEKALAFVAVSTQEWMESFVLARCAAAMEEIVAHEIKRKLAAGEPITGTKDEIVMAAPVELAADRQARMEAEIAARQAGA